MSSCPGIRLHLGLLFLLGVICGCGDQANTHEIDGDAVPENRVLEKSIEPEAKREDKVSHEHGAINTQGPIIQIMSDGSIVWNGQQLELGMSRDIWLSASGTEKYRDLEQVLVFDEAGITLWFDRVRNNEWLVTEFTIEFESFNPIYPSEFAKGPMTSPLNRFEGVVVVNGNEITHKTEVPALLRQPGMEDFHDSYDRSLEYRSGFDRADDGLIGISIFQGQGKEYPYRVGTISLSKIR